MARLVTLGMVNVIYHADATLAQRRANLLRLVESAGRASCQVVVLPEFADHHRTVESLAAHKKGLAEYVAAVSFQPDDPWLCKLAGLAREHHMVVIPDVLLSAGKNKGYNRALVYGPEGTLLGHYDKTHLAPGEDRYLIQGETVQPVATPFGKLGLLICYDINFPELTRSYELQGAEMLLWTTMRQGEHEDALYRLLLPARALEHRLPLAVATYADFYDRPKCRPMTSAVFSPAGFMIAGGLTTEGVVRATVDLDERPLTRRFWDKTEWVDQGRYLRRSRRPDLYGALVKPVPANEADLAQEPTAAEYPELA